jgi:hypothetical protein
VSCRTGCPSQDHANWGECARASNLQLGDLTGQGVLRTTDRRLGAYRRAREQGLQPPTTQLKDSLATLRAAGA